MKLLVTPISETRMSNSPAGKRKDFCLWSENNA